MGPHWLLVHSYAHGMLQPPQLSGSLVVSMHLVPHIVAAHSHLEALHAWTGVLHTTPHFPQLLESLVRSVHVPLHMLAASTHTQLPATHFSGTISIAVHASSAPGSSSTLPSQLSSRLSHCSVWGVQVQTP